MRRLLIAAAVLIVLLIVVDRISVAVANREVAKQVKAELSAGQDPDVSIKGFPFLWQAVRGKYSTVKVSIPDFDSGSLQDLDVDATLHGVHAPLGDVMSGSLDSVPVDRITGSLRVSYDSLSRASGIQDMRITAEGDQLRVGGTVDVGGQTVRATGLGKVGVAGNDLVITVTQATVDGVELPQATLASVAQGLTFRVSPRSLPLTLKITDVTPTGDGLTVDAEATQVDLRSGSVQSLRYVP